MPHNSNRAESPINYSKTKLKQSRKPTLRSPHTKLNTKNPPYHHIYPENQTENQIQANTASIKTTDTTTRESVPRAACRTTQNIEENEEMRVRNSQETT